MFQNQVLPSSRVMSSDPFGDVVALSFFLISKNPRMFTVDIKTKTNIKK